MGPHVNKKCAVFEGYNVKPMAFKKWRKSLGLSQKDAAHMLGLKRRVVQYYEKGERDGKKVEIPLSIRLACYALSNGIADFDGDAVKPSKHKAPADPQVRTAEEPDPPEHTPG